ncbi:hypothetical protein [Pulveribacter suum]|uniref:Uncharacterized protein n=1 Tax=Pulveribacter suum TaxID=2116657 RepID=A0A2P1NHQ5_9BURK|nr:hypothetical protein [Pulveribacter suum]AVP56589.1 hypothetical protein C7H73_02120 [Pulveribacter suum]
MPQPPLFLILATCLALAAPAASATTAEAETGRFMQARGYAPQDLEAAEARLGQHFAAHQRGAASPGAEVTPVEKALLLLELMEPALPRTRTVVRYGLVHEDPQADRFTPYAFVTVERYNLGPALRHQLVQEHGAAHVAPAREFGTGPHVAWRFVSRPVMGTRAGLLELARREITPAEAARTDCDGRPCLSLDQPMDALRPWRKASAPPSFQSPFNAQGAGGVASPARAAAELLAAAGLAGVETDLQGRRPQLQAHEPERPAAARGSQPYLFVTLDRNLAQEEGSDAVLHQSLLNDDAARQTWHRRVQSPAGVHFMRSTQPRR